MIFALAILGLMGDWASFGLGNPVRIRSGANLIDVEHGHAHPFLIDMNSDGKLDLLVGQFQGGKVRVYLNEGTAKAPKYGAPTWLQAGGTEATIPYG